MEGDILELEYQIINELTGKAKCVYDKLVESSSDYKDDIRLFDGEFPVSHLRFQSSSTLANDLNAQTNPPQNFIIDIEINSNNLSRPNLSIARTIMHETIHAEMFRKIMSILNNGGDLDGLTRSEWTEKLRNGDYPGIFYYYSRFGVNGMQHEQMAASYRQIMVNMMREFQPGLSEEIYSALSWLGLQETVTWNALTPEVQDRIDDVVRDFNELGAEGCN